MARPSTFFGRELVVTYNDGDSHIGEAEAAIDVQWITNFIIQPGYYGSDGEKKGYDRYQRIGEELARTGGGGEDGTLWKRPMVTASVWMGPRRSGPPSADS